MTQSGSLYQILHTCGRSKRSPQEQVQAFGEASGVKG